MLMLPTAKPSERNLHTDLWWDKFHLRSATMGRAEDPKRHETPPQQEPGEEEIDLMPFRSERSSSGFHARSSKAGFDQHTVDGVSPVGSEDVTIDGRMSGPTQGPTPTAWPP